MGRLRDEALPPTEGVERAVPGDRKDGEPPVRDRSPPQEAERPCRAPPSPGVFSTPLDGHSDTDRLCCWYPLFLLAQLAPELRRAMLENDPTLENEPDEKDLPDPDPVAAILGGLGRCSGSSGIPGSSDEGVALRFLELALALDRVVGALPFVDEGPPPEEAMLALLLVLARRDDRLAPVLLPMPPFAAGGKLASLGCKFSSNVDAPALAIMEAAAAELERRSASLPRLGASPGGASSAREARLPRGPSPDRGEAPLPPEELTLLPFASSSSNSKGFESTLGGANFEEEEEEAALAAARGGRGRLGLFFLGLDMRSNSSMRSSLPPPSPLSSLAWALLSSKSSPPVAAADDAPSRLEEGRPRGSLRPRW